MEGGGQKYPNFGVTSFMDAPLAKVGVGTAKRSKFAILRASYNNES